ncbi:MAG: MFS transporter, partial [Dokdonella sp.]|nr:MFS transporter [Dokdonella sp.]
MSSHRLAIQRHEWFAVAVAFVYFFCVLAAYYVLRPVRDAMGASADAQVVFPPALIAWAQARG